MGPQDRARPVPWWSAPATDAHVPRPDGPSRLELQARLQRVQEALREAPPHSAAGTRDRLEAERARLQRALALSGDA